MDYDALVRQIVERVAAKMNEGPPLEPRCAGGEGRKPGLLVLTGGHGERCHPVLEDPRLCECYRADCALTLDYRCDPADYEAVILFDLTVEAAAKLATGACDTPYTALAAKAILMGKQIFVPAEEVELNRYAATAPPAYMQMMRGQLALLEASGLTICPLDGLVDLILTGAAPKPACGADSAPCAGPRGEAVSIQKRVITERDITEAGMAGACAIHVGERVILTDLAKDLARSKGIEIIRR